MAGKNNTFYAKAISTSSIKVKDIFSAVLQRHSRDDLDTAFTAGLKGHIPEGSRMLDAWQKPWIFSRVLLYGALAWLLVVILNLGGELDAITIGAQFFVPAMVVPFVVVVFYWEMNIPRNIPIYDIIKFILFGGIIASVVNGIFSAIFNAEAVETASIAGLTEELTKLVIIAFILRRPDRCWGLNGLLIGAAVGAGFAIFETNGYGVVTLTTDGLSEAIRILNIRGVLSICGHVAYSAMYGCTLALAKGSRKLKPRHFFNPFFLITFFSAMLLHALWNADFIFDFLMSHGSYLESIANLIYGHNYIGIGLIFTLIDYSIIFWVLKMSLRQVVQAAVDAPLPAEGMDASGSAAPAPVYQANAAQPSYSNQPEFPQQPEFLQQPAYPQQPVYGQDGNYYQAPVFDRQESFFRQPADAQQADYQAPPYFGAPAQQPSALYLECIGGELAGSTFALEPGRTLTVGRAKDNQVKYADNAKGISGRHCSVGFNGGQAVVTDLGSSYGTFSSDGVKYQPNVGMQLNDGDTFYLAGEQNMFRIRIQ